MLKERLVTAILLALVFLAVLFYLPVGLFSLFIILAVLMAAWEWANLAGFSRVPQRLAYQAVVVTLFGSAIYFTGFSGAWMFDEAAVRGILVASCIWWALALLWVQSYPQSAVLWGNRWLRGLIGLLVLVPTGVACVYIRIQPQGAWLILMVVAIVVSADVGAYFSGKAFGKHKLAPAVSPGKSWEGFWGGLGAATVLALVIGAITGGAQWWVPLALVIPTSLASVLGDLLESMIKRHRGLKDSSHILPGHGGLMDRVDSLTAAAPVFALGLMLSGWRL
ncbi:phosphatidate cytidylyltransferase [Exilibacterium tricleocarpae]|uniref:Phosphatidate cytidylyltransferase n=1 Tax=Exilibacterium tricleocarpae TaxID=2591008 RepID=A0A545U859_9GAMM|nr:phosphatidate cytidylyltransferase [Exilibacterium tricleocarpae]TQV85654.1 phosphatidate cytidylyltransferase [Exilibacterium tricleocarpae]